MPYFRWSSGSYDKKVPFHVRIAIMLHQYLETLLGLSCEHEHNALCLAVRTLHYCCCGNKRLANQDEHISFSATSSASLLMIIVRNVNKSGTSAVATQLFSGPSGKLNTNHTIAVVCSYAKFLTDQPNVLRTLKWREPI
jgi:hypothetical protein